MLHFLEQTLNLRILIQIVQQGLNLVHDTWIDVLEVRQLAEVLETARSRSSQSSITLQISASWIGHAFLLIL